MFVCPQTTVIYSVNTHSLSHTHRASSPSSGQISWSTGAAASGICFCLEPAGGSKTFLDVQTGLSLQGVPTVWEGESLWKITQDTKLDTAWMLKWPVVYQGPGLPSSGGWRNVFIWIKSHFKTQMCVLSVLGWMIGAARRVES